MWNEWGGGQQGESGLSGGWGGWMSLRRTGFHPCLWHKDHMRNCANHLNQGCYFQSWTSGNYTLIFLSPRYGFQFFHGSPCYNQTFSGPPVLSLLWWAYWGPESSHPGEGPCQDFGNYLTGSLAPPKLLGPENNSGQGRSVLGEVGVQTVHYNQWRTI